MEIQRRKHVLPGRDPTQRPPLPRVHVQDISRPYTCCLEYATKVILLYKFLISCIDLGNEILKRGLCMLYRNI